MAPLRVEIGEELAAWTQNRRPVQFRTRHEALLCAALVLAQGQELDRAALAKALWPDNTPESATVNFRQRLCDLRKTLGDQLEADRKAVRLPIAPAAILLHQDAAQNPTSLYSQARQIAQTATLADPTPWSDKKLQIWLEEALQNPNAPCPFPASLQNLHAQAENPKAEQPTARLIAACVLARHDLQNGQNDFHFATAARILESIDPHPDSAQRRPPDPETLAPLAYLLELTAALARRNGNLAQAIAWQAEAAKQYQSANRPDQTRRAKFRTARMLVDAAQVQTGHQALLRFQDKPLPPNLAPYLELNLVFVEAIRGRLEAATQARDRAKAATRHQSPDTLSWLHLNESVLLCRSGKPRLAAAAILEAKKTATAPRHAVDHRWHWAQAVEVFAHLGDVQSTAVADNLVNRAEAAAIEKTSPLNRFRKDRTVAALTAKTDPRTWIQAQTQAENIHLTEADTFIQSRLQQITQGA